MKLALALIFMLASAPASGSEATDLASLVIEAYGGPEMIERSTSVEQSGVLDSYRHGKTGPIERTFSRPDKLRIDIQIPGEQAESRLLNGTEGWQDGAKVPPMMAKAMLLQAARLDLPYLIMKAGEALKAAGPVNRDDSRNLKSLEIPMAEGLRLIVVIDAERGYIVSSHGLIAIAANHQMEFTTVFSGHKELSGVIVATEEAHFVQGNPTGRTVLDRLDVVQELSDAYFRP